MSFRRLHQPLDVVWRGNDGSVTRPTRIFNGETVTFTDSGGEILTLLYKDGTLTLTPLTLNVHVSPENARKYADHMESL